MADLRPCTAEFRAGTALAAGLASAGTLYLYARGHRQEAVAVAISLAILGAFVGAAKVLADHPVHPTRPVS